VAADFNGDGKLDLAVANMADSNIFIYIGLGDGTFVKQSTLATGTGPNSLTVGDFNGDGRPDLVTANSSSNNASVLLRHVDTPTAVTVGSFSARKAGGAKVRWRTAGQTAIAGFNVFRERYPYRANEQFLKHCGIRGGVMRKPTGRRLRTPRRLVRSLSVLATALVVALSPHRVPPRRTPAAAALRTVPAQ
jgi:hypothetical protein